MNLFHIQNESHLTKRGLIESIEGINIIKMINISPKINDKTSNIHSIFSIQIKIS